MNNKQKLLIVSDFNADNLSAYLNADQDTQGVDARTAPFGQPAQVLLDGSMACWEDVRLAVVWTRPEGVIDGFRRLSQGEPIFQSEILDQVDQWCVILQSAAERVNAIFVPLWTIPAWDRGLGFIDLKHEQGIAAALMKMNARLLDNLAKVPNAYPLDATRWLRSGGESAAAAKLWYLGKIPFANPVFMEAAKEIKAASQSLLGAGRKLVILDLDDTLWGGIIGDDGIDGVKLGGHDPVGEAFFDFQTALRTLLRRGILLAIVSKNEESVALHAIENHPEMVLKKENFAAWRINWNDKAANVIEVVEELNLGLQSVVFIDDNPAERDRVREALPEVFVPDWPKDKTQYTTTLKSLSCFDQPTLSGEDAARSKLYAVERERRSSQASVASVDDWLKTLNVKVTCEVVNDQNMQRTIQLLNKTNQMNLTTRRLTEQELRDWLADERRQLWTMRISDKFGDLGLTGICSMQVQGDEAQVVDFILSCRVMGRKIEEAMLAILQQNAQRRGVTKLVAQYLPTQKNNPCLTFFQKAMAPCPSDENRFVFDLLEPSTFPECVTVADGAENHE